MDSHMGLGNAMEQVTAKLLTMTPEQLGAMMTETGAMLRSVDEKERAVGALLRVQVIQVLGRGVKA